jgi:hypothetical protein
MTHEECMELLSMCDGDVRPSWELLRLALSASLDREAELLGNGERLFDMALVRNRALEEAAAVCDASAAEELRDEGSETCGYHSNTCAYRIRALKTPPDAAR